MTKTRKTNSRVPSSAAFLASLFSCLALVWTCLHNFTSFPQCGDEVSDVPAAVTTPTMTSRKEEHDDNLFLRYYEEYRYIRPLARNESGVSVPNTIECGSFPHFEDFFTQEITRRSV
jgi:hypothetical protein